MSGMTKSKRAEPSIDKRSARFTDHRRKRRDEIVMSATQLLAEKGLQSLTIDEIAHELGLAKPVLYRYFSSKDGLVQHVLSNARQRLIEADISEDSSDWRKQLLGALRLADKHPEMFIILIRQAASVPEFQPYYQSYFDKVVDLTEKRLRFFSNSRPKPPATFSFCATALVKFIFSSMLLWFDEGNMDVEDFHKWLVHSVVCLTEGWMES